MKKKQFKVMTLEQALAVFEERMVSFRDAVFDLFLMPEETGASIEEVFARRDRWYKDDCLTAFNRAWVRKAKRGQRLLQDAVLKQTRSKKYGPVRTRNKADKPRAVTEEEKAREKKAKAEIKKRAKEAKKKRRARVAKKAPYKLGKRRKPGRPVYWKGATRDGHHAYINTRWGGRLRVY